MSDMKSINNHQAKPADQHIDQLRQKIGTDFSERKLAGKHTRNEMGKDDFVKLMSAQLKYQDPMSPMKNEEMAAQLAQFSALEQMMNVNQNLEKMTAAQKPQENIIAASLIGKRIATDTSRFQFAKGQQPEIKFELPEDANSVNISVVNDKGEVVRELDIGATGKGPQAIRWDGNNAKNQEQPNGEYSFRITAAGENSKPIQVKTSTNGLVSGVVFEGGKPMLLVDDKKIALDTVGKIEADQPSAGAQATAGAKGMAGGKSAKVAGANGASAAAKSDASSDSSSTKSVSKNSTQQVKNDLQDDISPEKINLMLQALRAAPPKEQANAANENAAAEGNEEGKMPDPLWNPSANL